ncbi:rhomboid family intramembrane serine protease [Catelliglobosispora koreensis]|uniref:rhomboid family intramembrane serine protease n=1 Tax=Catelliglobosispora koreensis TaxID=129052 RepID=UPI00047808B4|nr:rhomboid family intramembrane serine protease [Catelliglobosispora koreensis]
MTTPAADGQPVPTCYRHPGRETWIRCTRCDRPICPDCMIVASVGHQCPECVAEGRRTQRPALTHFGGSQIGEQGYVTKILIGINVAIFALTLIFYAQQALFGSTPIHEWAAMLGQTFTEIPGQPREVYVGAVPGEGPIHYGLDGGAYYRLVTSMFLHYGVLHLAVNMFALWQIGRPLEAALGPARFLALYMISGIGGSVAVAVFSPFSLAAGASGAIFGLFAAFAIILRKLGRDVMAILPVIVLNLVLTFWFSAYISVAGHIGGLVTGAICGLGLAYAPKENRTLVQTLALGGTLLALVGIAVVVTLGR